MHAAAVSPRGGVARRAANLRGQSIIEYVLIIAIIGLVIVFAGPGVAGAIRNQFNLVGNTLNSGTNGGIEGGGASGGGSTGADSATVQAAIAKDAKDWTLAEQKAVAEDIAAKGEASPAYAKAKAAMDAGTTWTINLNDKHSSTYRIVGINHDDLADGTGKAGLTFEMRAMYGSACVTLDHFGANSWEKSEIRQRLNSGVLWARMPSEFQDAIKRVKKYTDNNGEEVSGKETATVDKLFLVSATEVYGDLKSDGVQYEYYREKGVTSQNYSNARIGLSYYYTRSIAPASGNHTDRFYVVDSSGECYSLDAAANAAHVHPLFCF